MSWRQWSITVVWFAAVLSVVAQTSPVIQCIPSFDWSINSLQQTPCLVAAYLESACGTPTMIPAVPIGNHYLGPNATQADPCRCSTVTYSAISACAGCQNRTYIDWLTWSQDCTSTFLTIFPESLPSQATVEVPRWAYLNLTLTNNNFSVIAAEEVASETSTTSSAVTTSTSISNSLSSSSTVLANPTLASPSPSSTSSGNSSSKSNAGAIAGGVVGGIGFVAIVGLGALWFFLRRKRNNVQKNVAFDRRALVSGTGMSQTTGSTQGVLPFPYQPSQSIFTSDMSLYPGTPKTTPGPGTLYPSRRSLESSVPHSVAHFGGGSQTQADVPVIPRGYTGMPEI